MGVEPDVEAHLLVDRVEPADDAERTQAEQRARTAQRRASTAERRANTAERRASTAEQRADRLAELTRRVLAQQATPAELQELERLLQLPPSQA